MNWADQEYAIGRGVAAIRHKNDSALQPFVRGVIELGLSELLAQLAEIPYPSLDEDEQRAIAHLLIIDELGFVPLSSPLADGQGQSQRDVGPAAVVDGDNAIPVLEVFMAGQFDLLQE